MDRGLFFLILALCCIWLVIDDVLAQNAYISFFVSGLGGFFGNKPNTDYKGTIDKYGKNGVGEWLQDSENKSNMKDSITEGANVGKSDFMTIVRKTMEGNKNE